MPTLIDRLTDSAPEHITPLDHRVVAGRARARRRRNRAGTLCLTLLAVGGLVAGVVRVTTHDDDRTRLAASPIAPDGTVLNQGFGTWIQGADSPLGARSGSFSGVLSDGRVIVWGGFGADADGEHPVGPGAQTGAIYDRVADEWTEISAAPKPLRYPEVHFADDRMLVAGLTPSGAFGANMYDVESNAWLELPDQAEISVFADSIAWDGETAVIIRVAEGGHGYAADTGIDPQVDWAVAEPVTLRWSRGDDRWTHGTPAPLTLRFGAGTLHHDGRIYVIGGTERNPWEDDNPSSDGAPDDRARADAVFYDIGNDEWTALPDLPEPGIHVYVGARPDGTILAGGALSTLRGSSALSASWILDEDTWTPFPSHPDTGAAPIVENGIVQTTKLQGHSGPQPESIFVDGRWEQAPLSDLHHWEHLLVATSGTKDNPDDQPFTVRLRAASDSWLTSAPAPFTNRMDAVIQLAGDQLVVIGGSEGRELKETATTWVLYLAE